MESITENPYFSKVVLTIVALVVKLALDKITKDEKELKDLQKLFGFIIHYALPIIIIIWLNLDSQIEDSKLNTTLIAFNFGLFTFNYLQTKVTQTNKMIADLANAEFDKVEKVKQINETQVEKIKAINDNQKYILSELSKINDRIINFIGRKS